MLHTSALAHHYERNIRESFHHSSTCLYWVEESDMESQELKSQEIKHRMKTNSILNFLPSFFSISQLPCLDLWRGRQSEKKINIKTGIKKLVHTMHILKIASFQNTNEDTRMQTKTHKSNDACWKKSVRFRKQMFFFLKAVKLYKHMMWSQGTLMSTTLSASRAEVLSGYAER